jgi:hypothetical protein
MNSFKVLAGFLKRLRKSQSGYAMVGFPLSNTLSQYGMVARGVCQVGRGQKLKEIQEHPQISREGRKMFFLDEFGKRHPFKGREIVSMNMWGFTPKIFQQIQQRFETFLNEMGEDLKKEFLIPRVVGDVLLAKEATVKVLSTKDRWFGITYPQDKEQVRLSMEKMIQKGYYPSALP